MFSDHFPDDDPFLPATPRGGRLPLTVVRALQLLVVAGVLYVLMCLSLACP